MKICFLSLYKTYDYRQVGGTDSYMRRLTGGLKNASNNIEIVWLFYDAPFTQMVNYDSRFRAVYCQGFAEALKLVEAEHFDHLISVYIRPQHRLQFAQFRRRIVRLRYHNLMFFYPNSMIGKCLKLSEFTIYPYSGTVFCVSHRQVLMLRGFVDRMCYLPPCIPSSYHINPSQKKRNLPLNISFLGRIDPRKGVLETLDLFEKLAHNSSYNCRIYGIYIPRDGQATAIHHRLKRQSLIQYIEVERQAYSGSTEELALSVLRDSDIFVQPYRSMDSTVDSPLLLLEAMASSCAVLTTPIADVPRLYGDSNFVIQNQQFAESALHLLMHLSPGTLTEEQNRSHKQLTHMELAPASIAKKMLDATE